LHRAAPAQHGRGLPVTRRVIAAVLGLLAAVALAAPAGAEGGKPTVVLVVDVSASMAGSRLAAAKQAAAGYAGALPAALRLGLVAVADTPVTLVPPTTDRAAFRAAVAGLRAGGRTALYDGVRQA